MNDTHKTVILEDCGDENCPDKIDGARFVPGGVWRDQAISSAGVLSLYRASDPRSGRPLGCLPVVTTKRMDNKLVVKLSEMVPCQKSYDEEHQWPDPTRACGVLTDGADVDLAEGDLDLVTCAQAVAVMRDFRDAGQESFRRFGHSWSCYKSRQDGIGWDYHCNTSSPYLDIGAGRR